MSKSQIGEIRKNDDVSSLLNTIKKLFAIKENIKIQEEINDVNQILIKILETAREYNKGKEKALNRFLESYILNMNLIEESYLLSKIYYYLEVYEIHSIYGSEKLDDITEYPDSFSKKEILSELLLDNTYLPVYTNQEQFNSDMKSFLERLEKRITRFRKTETPIVFTEISPKMLFNYMDDLGTSCISGVKKFDKGIIKDIGYTFDLASNIDFTYDNQYHFSINFDGGDISREVLETYLSQILNLKTIDGKYFIYEQDNFFRYDIYLGEYFYKSGAEYDRQDFEKGYSERGDNLGFEMRIYAKPRLNLQNEEEFTNVCIRLPGIVEGIITDLYKYYEGSISIENRSEIYPTKREVFNIHNLLNNGEDESGEDFDISNLGNKISYNNDNSKNKNIVSFHKINETPELVLKPEILREVDKLVYLINNEEELDYLGLKLPKGICFEGPSGTGKTSLAKYIASKTKEKVKFAEVNYDQIKGQYVGESEKGARQLFSLAREEVAKGYKVILWFDELDGLLNMGRLEGDVDAGMRAVILSETDGVETGKNDGIILAGATNYFSNISRAFRERLNKVIKVDLPDEKDREKLLDFFIKKYDKFDFDLDREKLVKMTSGLSHRFFEKWFENVLTEYKYSIFKKEISEGVKIDNNFFEQQFKITKKDDENSIKKMGFKI